MCIRDSAPIMPTPETEPQGEGYGQGNGTVLAYTENCYVYYLYVSTTPILDPVSPPGMDIGKDLVAASATRLVLAILSVGENYGYAIIKRLEELSAGELQWTDGMLYPVLHRLAVSYTHLRAHETKANL